MDGYLQRYVFDPEYERDYTPLRFDYTNANLDETDLKLTFDNTILVWGYNVYVDDYDLITPGQVVNRSLYDYYWVEGINRSTSLGGNTIKAEIFPKTGPQVPLATDEARYSVVELTAAVDGNRDGQIKLTDKEDRSLLFWYNDDHEGTDSDTGVQQDEVEPPPSQSTFPPDSYDNEISSSRDLEDFAAMTVFYDPLLENTSLQVQRYGEPPKQSAGARSVDGSKSLRSDGGTSTDSRHHVHDSSVGIAIGGSLYKYAIAQVALPTKSPRSTITYGMFGGMNDYLFEFVPPPVGWEFSWWLPHPSRNVDFEIVIDVAYPDGRTKTLKASLDFDARDLKEFYDVYEVPTEVNGNDVRLDPDVTSFPNAILLPQNEATIYDGGHVGFSESEYLLQVHGWNMAPIWKTSFAETAYKRLYWQGYAGRFGVFNWPTLYDDQSPILNNALGANTLNLTYNPSEFIAFRSAAALTNTLADLRPQYDRLTVIAHSMGNVVVGEALRLWDNAHDGQPLVNTYVAMQAAVSAGAYGYDTNYTHTDTDLYSHNPAFASLQSDALFGRDQTAAQKWVNFYNPDDYALVGGTVIIGQSRLGSSRVVAV